MSNVVLDASALLALVSQEPGHMIVADLLPNSLISAVNLSEFVAKLTEQAMPEQDVQMILAELNLTVIPFEEEQGITAGYLRLITKPYGLSLGDRACLALGLQTQCPVITADRAWAARDIGLDIQVIR